MAARAEAFFNALCFLDLPLVELLLNLVPVVAAADDEDDEAVFISVASNVALVSAAAAADVETVGVVDGDEASDNDESPRLFLDAICF